MWQMPSGVEMMAALSSETRQQFLSLLFDAGEASCFTNTARGITVRSYPLDTDLFFSINPLDGEKDTAPTKDWHAADKPRRADVNVTAYRNFLIELDDMPLNKQRDYVAAVFPVSSIVLYH